MKYLISILVIAWVSHGCILLVVNANIVWMDGKLFAFLRRILVTMLLDALQNMSLSLRNMPYLFLILSLLKKQLVSFFATNLVSIFLLFLSLALLCAGVTVYKGLKELSLHSGQWVGIIGAGGGLGHVAMQYAHALGYRVIAIDIGKDKTSFCRAIPGVEHAIDLQCHDTNEATVVEELLTMTKGGCHGMLVVAAHASSYSLALDCCRRKGVIVALGLPATNVSLDMMKMVRQGITLKGSIVGTRYDMIECLDFAARGLVRPHVTMMELDQVNEVMQEMMENKVIGRVVFQVEKSKKH